MSVATVLLETYNRCEKAGLVDRSEYIENETVLLPLHHSNTKSEGNNIIELVFNNNGVIDIELSGYLSKGKYIIYPVTENSVSRSSNVCARPLVDELQYIIPKEGKNGLYLSELSQWIDNETDEDIKRFIDIVYNFVKKQDVLDVLAKVISRGNPYTIDRKEYLIVVLEIDDKGKEKENKFQLKKTLLTFKILSFCQNKDQSVTSYKRLHTRFISYYKKQISRLEQQLCSLTGQLQYCTKKHRGIMGSAKIISASNHREVYCGRFKDKDEIISVGYETSQKIHNMLKYLWENDNSSEWLDDKCYLVTWFSDDVSNSRGTNIVRNTQIGSVDSLFRDVEKDSFQPASNVTKNVTKSVKRGIKYFNHNAEVYILILDNVCKGRIAVTYFQKFPQSQFYANIQKWEETFNWYFYDRSKNCYTLQTQNLYKIVNYIFGTERDGVVGFSKNEKKYRANLLISLLPCITEGKRLPVGFYKKACQNIRVRHKYPKSWPTVRAMSCAVINKYKTDFEGERIGKSMLDLKEQSRSYLYGRLLSAIDYIESSASSDGKRITNAQRFWTAYTKSPRKTLHLLLDKLISYEKRLFKSDNKGALINAKKVISECVLTIEELEKSESTKKQPLSEDFIFGYYSQESDFFTKKEKKQADNKVIEENNSKEVM